VTGGYRTKVGTSVDIPPLVGSHLDGSPFVSDGVVVLLGAFSLKAIGEVSLWRKLLESRDTPFLIGLFRTGWADRQIEEVEACFPPSLHGQVILALDEADSWSTLVEVDKSSRAFAAVISGDRADVLMVGPPTEEAWDLFQAFLP
jgi:hypothetical protein